MEKFIAVADYGLGNLRSVSKALESEGVKVIVSSSSKDLLSAKGIVLPGVGSFQRGMENLKEKGIAPALLEAIQKGKPFLGICLGLQLLFTESEEQEKTSGLNIIKGKVKRFKGDLKIPHIGWNQVKQVAGYRVQATGLFEGIADNSYFYFVHSYYVQPEDENVIAATTNYGEEFVSAIVQKNIWGVQFHPEKSGELGLRFLKNFISLC